MGVVVGLTPVPIEDVGGWGGGLVRLSVDAGTDRAMQVQIDLLGRAVFKDVMQEHPTRGGANAGTHKNRRWLADGGRMPERMQE